MPFESKPIPPEILSQLDRARKGVGADAFVYQNPILAIQQKLMNPDMAGQMNWRCAVQTNEDGERVFAGVMTAIAAHAAEHRLCGDRADESILPLAVYTDESILSTDGRHVYNGMWLDIMSQKDAKRQSLTGPILVGLIPSFSGSGKEIKKARLQLWHWCMSQLVEDLQAGCAGVEFAARFGTLHSMSAPNRTCSLFLAAAGLLGRFER